MIVRNARRNPVSSDERTVLPGAHLVLQSFEVDDVRVDGDTDRHDDAGDAREREREALRAPTGTTTSVKNSMPVSASPIHTTRPSSR